LKNLEIPAILRPIRTNHTKSRIGVFACNILRIAAILDEARQKLTKTTMAAYEAPGRQ
jgi:hypothetical protein